MKKALLLLALAACSPKGSDVVYVCENPDGGAETIVKARFYEGGVDIDINGRDQRKLVQAVSASGARYAADEVEFWTKGKGATLTTFGASTDCVQK
ncbi:MAG: MliC family protein [Rickettsiales bacterium]|jgi:membrane-bound inhibitor of C-type lysozyme|nr:MliC family protein [Rickettsiales bacterium]